MLSLNSEPVAPRSGNSGWFQTYSGKKFWAMDPRPEDVDIKDIAHALSNVCRFGGHVRKFYSVAQHSVHVSRYLAELHPNTPALHLFGLLHDASEAYIGDVVRPLKMQMPEYQVCEERLMGIIHEALGLEYWSQYDSIIKFADNALLGAERLSLINHCGVHWSITEPPWPYEIIPWSPELSESTFLMAYELLVGRLQ